MEDSNSQQRHGQGTSHCDRISSVGETESGGVPKPRTAKAEVEVVFEELYNEPQQQESSDQLVFYQCEAIPGKFWLKKYSFCQHASQKYGAISWGCQSVRTKGPQRIGTKGNQRVGTKGSQGGEVKRSKGGERKRSQGGEVKRSQGGERKRSQSVGTKGGEDEQGQENKVS